MIGIKKEERHFRIYINYLKTTARKKKSNFNDIHMSQGHILFTGTQTEACIVER